MSNSKKMDMLTIPEKAEIYINLVNERSRLLIQKGIWEGMGLSKLNTWLKNFTSLEERYFGACILDSLIYRSDRQTNSLINELFYRNFDNLFSKLNLFENQMPIDWHIKCQSCPNIPNFRFSGVFCPKDPPTKSSHIILRQIKRNFGIHDDWIIQSHDVLKANANGTSIIIFMDDFLGSGQQFLDMCYTLKLMNLINDSVVIYAPLVAHTTGINNLKLEFPQLHVVYAELLNDENNFFAMFQNDPHNDINTAKEYYLTLLNSKNINVPNPFGYSELSLTYAFQHAAPDNSIPVLWYNENNWHPLFNR